MAFSSWRGTAGLVMPTMRPGAIEGLMRLLPEGISILPLYNNIRRGTREELESVMGGYETKVKELAEVGVDLIHPAGGPPFMVLGFEKERELLRRWQQTYKIPMFTTGSIDSEALRALQVKRFVGISYFTDDVNRLFVQYYRAAGFECIDIASIGVAFDRMQELSETEIYRFARETFLAHPEAQGLYLLGSWHAERIIAMMEQDFGIPVVWSKAAQSWGIQRFLHVREPLPGSGRLLNEMPDRPD